MATARHKDQLKSYLASHRSPGKVVADSKSVGNAGKKSKIENDRPSSGGDVNNITRKFTKSVNVSSGPSSPASKPQDRKVATRHPHIKTATSVTRRGNSVKPGKVSINDLPDEVLLQVFSELGASDLLTSARVCTRWKTLANDNKLWQQMFKLYAVKVKGPLPEIPQHPPTAFWKKHCIDRCSNHRNSRALALLKKQSPFTCLPMKTKEALQRAGVRWHLVLTDSSSVEHTLVCRDVLYFPMSVTLRWYDLQMPSLASIRKLAIYAVNPVFFNDKGEPYKNSPCQRSLLKEMPFEWRKLSSRLTVDGADDQVLVHCLSDLGILLARWKGDGELAFIAVSLHSNMLVQRCLKGTTDSAYLPTPHKIVKDDVDSQYGLHGYSCTVELRNFRNSYWSQQFQHLHCKREHMGGGFAVLCAIRPDFTSDHVPIDKKLNLPWKTDLFKNIVQDVCVLDLTLLDERKDPMWCISSPVAVHQPKHSMVNYDYGGDMYHIAYADNRGRVTLQLIWEPEREQLIITCLELSLSSQAINHWFGTSY